MICSLDIPFFMAARIIEVSVGSPTCFSRPSTISTEPSLANAANFNKVLMLSGTRYIQERNPACRLEVDGGVDPVTARQVVEAGADVLVAGSAIYGAPDPAQAIRALRGE